MGAEFPSVGVKKCFGTRWKWWLHDILNVLNATELYTSKWLLLWYMKFNSVKVRLLRPPRREWSGGGKNGDERMAGKLLQGSRWERIATWSRVLEWPGKHPHGESQANGQGVRISGREGTPRLGAQTWEEGVSTPSSLSHSKGWAHWGRGGSKERAWRPGWGLE